jgi:rubredoxin
MRKVFVARTPTEAHFIKGLLEAEGIYAIVQGEALFGARGELPLTFETLPSVWVLDDALFDKAFEFAERFSNGQGAATQDGVPWTCPKCGEQSKSQFTECWQCNASRPVT